MEKFYVCRIVNHNGRKEYKRTKCADIWVASPYKKYCWQFSEQGAKGIVKTYNDNCRSDYYTYGMEPVE